MGIIILGTNMDGCASSSGCAVRARISFEMFKHIYAPALSSYGTPGFWQRVVLQASDMSQAIKHLILAASTFYQGPEPNSTDVRVTGRRSVPFLAHYGRALHLLGRCASADVIVVLVACVLLAVCDDLQQDSSGAQRHIQAGQRILLSQSNALQLYRWEQTAVFDEIASTFSRLCAPRPASCRFHSIKDGPLDLGNVSAM
jgi:hypothetical protein